MAANNQVSLSSILELSNTGIEDIGVMGFLVVMAVSLLSSFFIAALYLRFYGSRATGSQIHRAFPLLGMSVTAIFICIQFSLPLSLGLLGALSIVRFRTPIKEPEEIGFIMLVIGASIAAATFSMYFLVILLMFASIALVIQQWGFRLVSKVTDDGMILLTVPSGEYQAKADALKQLLGNRLIRPRMESVSKSADNSVVTYSFRGFREGDAVDLQLAVEELLAAAEINVYLNKQATL